MRLILVRLAIVGSAFALAATDTLALCSAKAIPLPGQALIESIAKISCDLTSRSLNDGEGQSDARLNNTLSMKLDYERQCYRHTEMILNNGLRRLQAAVGETINAINKCRSIAGRSNPISAFTGVPRPEAALLSSPSEFNCEFKNDSPVQPESDTLRGQEVALNMKFDYERQCYRHAALIAHDRLQRLQSSVRETVRAVNTSRAGSKSSPSVWASSASRRPSHASGQLSAPKQQMRNVRNSADTEQAPCATSGDRCIGRDPDAHIRSMMQIEAHGDF
jgi:hypothetical protein